MSPVLFAVLEYGEFPELLRVADVLHERLKRPILFFFVKRGYRRLSEDSKAVLDRGFAWIDADGVLHEDAAPAQIDSMEASPVLPVRSPEPRPPLRVPTRSRLRRVTAVARLPLYGIGWFASQTLASARAVARDTANFLRDYRRFRRRYAAMEALLRRVSPALLVVGQEPPGTELPFLLSAAGRLGVPRLIAPFAMFSLRETAEFGSAKADHQVGASAINLLVARAFPQWVLSWKQQHFLRLPGSRALALECAGLVQGLPWTPLSEPVEAIASDSRVAANALAAIGVDRQRIVVVGSPVHDSLKGHLDERALLRQRLSQDYKFDMSHPLLLCGWPANIFPWLAGRAIQFPDYPSLARAWALALADVRDRFGVNVIVSIHPKTLPEEYQAAVDHGLACRLGGTDELVAACDIFTTLNGSSVTAWAIACGVPILLYDCFETNYTDFNDVPGCIQVRSEADFLEQLYVLCGSQGERDRLASAQQRVAADWGELDGNSGKRLGDLASALTGSNA